MPPRTVKIAGRLYRAVAKIDDQYLRGSGVRFWIHCLVECGTGSTLPVKGRQVRRVPPEIERDLDDQQRFDASRAAEAGHLWYFRVDGQGWNWQDSKGAQQVQQLHRTLQWIDRFRHQNQHDGCRLIYCDVTNELA